VAEGRARRGKPGSPCGEGGGEKEGEGPKPSKICELEKKKSSDLCFTAIGSGILIPELRFEKIPPRLVKGGPRSEGAGE